MTVVMTYNSLLDNLSNWAERESDTTMIATLPTMIAEAENMVAREFKVLGFQKSVSSAFIPNQSWLSKPVRWRETITLNFGTGTGFQTRNQLLPRSYDYCRLYWPDPTVVDEDQPPKYYADWEFSQWLIVPTPAIAYPFELVYYERPTPLDADNQTNWITLYAPDLMLKACMLVLNGYLKNWDTAKYWQGEYDRVLSSLTGEDRRRIIDRSIDPRQET